MTNNATSYSSNNSENKGKSNKERPLGHLAQMCQRKECSTSQLTAEFVQNFVHMLYKSGALLIQFNKMLRKTNLEYWCLSGKSQTATVVVEGVYCPEGDQTLCHSKPGNYITVGLFQDHS